MRKSLPRSSRLLAALLLAAAAALVAGTDALWRVDVIVYDAACRALEGPAPADVVLVGIDEASLAAYGRWPWPRRLHAQLVDKLSAKGAAAIAFDVAFAEPGAPADDARLAAALRASGVVVLPVFPEQSARGTMVETLPIPSLAAAATLGHADVELDPDGLARSLYLQAGLGSPRWPALARAVQRVAEGRAVAAPPPSAPVAASYLWVRDDRVLVAFTGPPGRFRHVSFRDVLEQPLPSDWPPRAIVLVGLTAAGLGDSLPTPVSGRARPMTGVEFVANVLEALRRGRAFDYVGSGITAAATAALVLLATALLAWLRRPAWGALAALALTLGLCLLLLHVFHLWFTPAAALAAIAAAYPLEAWQRHRRDRESLARERALRDTTLASMAEAVLTTDREGRLEYVNPIAESWLGRNAGELAGRRLEAILELRRPHGGRVLDGLAAAQVDDAVLVTRGQSRSVRASVNAFGRRDGRVDGLVVVLADAGNGSRAGAAHAPAVRAPARPEAASAQPAGQARNRAALEAALREAVAQDALEVEYQPQLDLRSGRVVGVEALARWCDPVHGRVPPSVFIPVAEEIGLIPALGERVLRSACRQAAAWKAAGVAVRLSVNVSPRQIASRLTEVVVASLREVALDPGDLVLELTESARLEDFDATSAAFCELRSAGVRLALDDFGVGCSSLEHLRRLPVDFVKIDKSFVQDLAVDPRSRSICIAVLAMAQSLGRRVVAEGVETEAHAEFLAARGCDEIQGYLISPPVPATQVPALVARSFVVGPSRSFEGTFGAR